MSFSGGGGGTTRTVTATGTIAVAPGDQMVVWQPAVSSGTVNFVLPLNPSANETHTFKARFAQPGPIMQVSANTGQALDGNPGWTRINPNDVVSVRWLGGAASWAIV